MVRKLVFRYLSFFYVIYFLFLFSCNNKQNFNRINNEVDICLQEKQNAIDVLEKKFEEKRIIFVGCSNHSTINDVIFFNEKNLQRLYDKGVRYILCEGGLENKFIYDKDDLEKKYITVFYPWESVGAVYSKYSLHNAVLKINSKLPENAQIKIIGLEGKRKQFIVSESDESEIINYRDKYMFEVAQKFIEKEDDNVKFLILCGAFHGATNILVENGRRIYPLAYYLNKEYHDDFEAFAYISLSSIFIDSMYYKDFLENKKWTENDYKQKFLNISEIKKLNRYVPIFADKGICEYTNFIVDKNACYGIKYGYVFFEDYVLKEILHQTKIINQELIDKTINLKDLNAEDFFKIEDFLKNIYYLKLFYGDKFDYDFWNPKNSLTTALEMLPKSYAPKINMSYQQMEYYQNLLSVMLYLKFSDSKKHATFYYNYGKSLIEEARLLLPEEVWFDYWQAMMNYKIGEYQKSLDFCKSFLSNKQFSCSKFFPEILDLAIKNSSKLKLDCSKFEKQFNCLRNEFDIDVNKIPYL